MDDRPLVGFSRDALELPFSRFFCINFVVFLGGILGNLATRLQSFDIVIVRPRGTPAAAAAAGTAAAELNAAFAVPSLETAGRPVGMPAPSNEEEAVVSRTQTGTAARVSEGGGSGLALPRDRDAPRESAADKVGLSVSGEPPAGSSTPEEGGMTITVRGGVSRAMFWRRSSAVPTRCGSCLMSVFVDILCWEQAII